MQTMEGMERPELWRPTPLTFEDAEDAVADWLLLDATGEPCDERITQGEAAKRLGISRQRLSQMEEARPPRQNRGKGKEAWYSWPAVAFWFLEAREALKRRKSDPWFWETWLLTRPSND